MGPLAASRGGEWEFVARRQGEAVRELLAGARERAVVVSPFISRWGADYLLRSMPHRSRLAVDVLTGATEERLLTRGCDPDALLALVRGLPTANLRTLATLHAKAYIADSHVALITSANLTQGGLLANHEYGVLIRDPAAVQQVAADLRAYARLGTPLPPEVLEPVAAAVGQEDQRGPAPDEGAAQRRLSILQDIGALLLRSHVAGRTEHAVFGDIILAILQREGPLTTRHLHPLVQMEVPWLCDDSVDRVIEGRHFGKRWKHQVRSAQQHLKAAGLVELVEGRWCLAR